MYSIFILCGFVMLRHAARKVQLFVFKSPDNWTLLFIAQGSETLSLKMLSLKIWKLWISLLLIPNYIFDARIRILLPYVMILNRFRVIISPNGSFWFFKLNIFKLNVSEPWAMNKSVQLSGLCFQMLELYRYTVELELPVPVQLEIRHHFVFEKWQT